VSRMIRVTPGATGVEQQRWSFRSLLTFLNELSDVWGRIRNRVLGSQCLEMDSAEKDGEGDRRMTAKVGEEWNISVQISRPDMVVWDRWRGLRGKGAHHTGLEQEKTSKRG
jgi:hypothetical protein